MALNTWRLWHSSAEWADLRLPPFYVRGLSSEGSEEGLKEGLAAAGDVVPGLLEVAGVPGVGDVSGMVCRVGGVGVVEEEGDLALRVVGEDAAEAVAVLFVHEDEEVVVVVVGTGDLPCAVVCAMDAVGFEGGEGHGVDGVADLLARGGGGVYLEAVRDTHLLGKVAEEELGSDAAADVAVADEEDFLGIVIHVANFFRVVPSRRRRSRGPRRIL